MKRFFENTLISGAFSKALRVVALLCVLLGVITSAWGASTVTIYFDNTNTQWPENSIYLYMGHGSYSRSDWQMTKVSGNLFKCDNVTYWDDATQIAFAKDQWSKSGEGNSLSNRLPHQGEKNYTTPININRSDATAYVYTATLKNGVYELTQTKYSDYTPGGDTPSSGGHKGTNLGFWDNEAWNIKIGNNWNIQTGYGATGNTDIELGTISGGTTIGFWTQTWKKKDVANVCSPRVYVKLTKGSTTIKNYDDYEIPYSSESESNGSINQLWLSDNVFSLPTEAGTYQMKVYFEMWGNESANNGCNQLSYLLNNGEGNYIFNFTISGSVNPDPSGECTTVYLNDADTYWNHSGAELYVYYFNNTKNTNAWKKTDSSIFLH